MKKVLISLISDQLIPNLLFIKEKQEEVGVHILVTTKYTEGKGAADRLAKVAGLSAGTWEKVEVIEDSLDDIREKLEAMNLPTSNKYLLNLTGGTKIMSIGVSRFFEEYDHESYYSTIGKNSFKRIFPRDDDREQAFSNELSLSDYLAAYGFKILKSGLPAWATQELAQRFYSNSINLLKYRPQIIELSKYSQENLGKIYVIPSESKLNSLLKEVSWKLNTNNRLSPEEIQFLISGWWEAFAYFRLKNDLKLNNHAIAVNCHIVRDQIPNELDVVFVRNNKLFVAECKTGFGPKEFKERFNNAIYKMAAIRNNMGLRIPGFLFMLDAKVRENGAISPLYADRAKNMDTTIIDKKILENTQDWPSVLKKMA